MHAARPSSPGNPAHLACISAAHAATGPCCASTTDDVAAIVRKDTAAIVVNRKLDRAVMSRLLWTLVFRLGGEYLSQVSWAATPSPALVGNPKTETGIGASDIAAHGARTPESGHPSTSSRCPFWATSRHGKS